MSSAGAGSRAVRRIGIGADRMSRAWRKLPSERKLAAGSAIGLFVTLFLPWYQETVIVNASTKATDLRLTSASITGWGAFSFVEAAVLLVAVAVLVLLFFRAEDRAFHVPGGDGGVITAAGFWTGVLILWRIFDRAAGQDNHGQYLTSSGIEWGIFIALGITGCLAYAGSRIRLAHEPEPPLPAEPAPSRRGATASAAEALGGVRRRARTAPAKRPPRSVADGGLTRGIERSEGSDVIENETCRLPGDEDETRPLAPGAAHRASRGLGLPDLDEIEFEDPPTARLSRPRPIPARPPRSAEDETLSTRVDPRPD